MRRLAVVCLLVLAGSPAAAQSLYLAQGQHAASAGVGWSTGPASSGVESEFSVGFGRVDLGVGISHYTFTPDTGEKSAWTEYAPFARVFLFREMTGAPVSVAVGGQFFVDDFALDNSGHYGQVSATVYKWIPVSDHFAIQPFGGFGFVAESYRYGGGDRQRAQYLTRDFGLNLSTAIDRPWMVLVTFRDQAFRTESYRSVRLSFIRKW